MAPHKACFHVGDVYSNDEIRHALAVGNAGGVRISLDSQKAVRRVVVTTSLPSIKIANENPYHDRIEGDVLVYTGAGREGDQTLGGVNQRLSQQFGADFPIYGFQMIGSRRDPSGDPKRWRFLGLLEYLRHYTEQQIDVGKQLRQVWIFEFRILTVPVEIEVANDVALSQVALSISRQQNAAQPNDRELGVANDSATLKTGSQFDAAQLEGVRRRFLSLSPEEFEHGLRDVLVASGFERVSVTKFSQDGGIDLNAYLGSRIWPLAGLHLQVQAKRWLHTVGRKEVAELRGSLQPFARGSVVTTSHFSKTAIQEANEFGKNPIVLVDGYRLAATALSLGITI